MKHLILLIIAFWCIQIAALQLVCDNTDANCEKSPSTITPANFWWTVSSGGYNGSNFYYTYTTNSGSPGNYAIWRFPNITQGGTYKVEAFIPSTNATSQQAPYKIFHNGITTSFTLNQNNVSNNWANLGEYYFTASSNQYVRLNDNSGEPYVSGSSNNKKLAFDAIRLTLVLTSNASSLSFNDSIINQTNNFDTRGVSIYNNTASSTTFSVSLGGTNPNQFYIEYGGGTQTLPPMGNNTFSVSFRPTSAGYKSATLNIGDMQIALSGTGISQNISIGFNQSSFNFGDQTINTTSSYHSITLTNNGTSGTATGTISVSGSSNFSIVGGAINYSLPPSNSTSFNVVFAPTSPIGAKTATVTATNNQGYPSQTCSLSGNCVGVPVLNLNPSNYSFGNQQVQVQSSLAPFVLTNTGTGNASGSLSINDSGFGFSGTSSFSLAPNAQTTFYIYFQPQSTGVYSTNVSYNGINLATLSGTGVGTAQLSITPSSTIDFGSQLINTESPSQTLTVTNTGTASTDVTISITGSNQDQFELTGDTYITLTPTSSSNVSVKFHPTTTGPKTATLAASGTGGCVSTVSLSGTGIGTASLVVSPLSYDFGSVNVEETSPSYTFVLLNNGTAAVNGVISITGASASSFSFQSGGGSYPNLNPQEERLILVRFNPLSAGIKTATLQITGGANTISATITGTGVIPQTYKLPYPTGVTMHITNGYNTGYHVGIESQYCVDFNMAGTNDAGIPVLSIADGVVSRAYWSTSYGYRVIVNHSNGISSDYAHGESMNVKQGDSVIQGQELMILGNTGSGSSGYHLHFGMRNQNGTTSIPLPTISGYSQWMFNNTMNYTSDNVVSNPGILIEETQAELSGSNFDGSSGMGHNHNYSWKYATSGNANMTLTYRPNFQQEKTCDVYVFIPSENATATSVPYTIRYSNQNRTVNVNQIAVPPNPSKPNNWILLGRFNFGIGTDNYVQLSNHVNNYASGLKVGFDAIYFKAVEGGGGGTTEERVRIDPCTISPAQLTTSDSINISLGLNNFGSSDVSITEIVTELCTPGDQNWSTPLYSTTQVVNQYITASSTLNYTYQIVAPSLAGDYDLNITVKTQTDSVAFWSQPISVIAIPYATIPYETGFESGALDQYWAINSSTQFGHVNVTGLFTPYAGNYHLTISSSSGVMTTNGAMLRVNLSSVDEAKLLFKWKNFGDEAHALDGVYFSVDSGNNYIKINNLTGNLNQWKEEFIDLKAIALANALSLTSNCVIKFQEYDDLDLPSDGFAFDNIKVVQQLPSVTGLNIGIDDETVMMNFNIVDDAESYKIMVSDSPDNGFTEIFPNSIQAFNNKIYVVINNVTGSKKFFKVIANY